MPRKKTKPKWEPSKRKIGGLDWTNSGNIPKTKPQAQKDKQQLRSWGLQVRVVKTVGKVHSGKYMTYVRGRARNPVTARKK